MQLAHAFRDGLGVPRDPVQSAKWTLKAANQGDPVAQTDMGYSYLVGLGVPVDSVEAFRWFQRAATANYAPAENDLGLLLMKGLGVPQDIASGVKWVTKAAEQRCAPAELHLGIFFSSRHWGRARSSRGGTLGTPGSQAKICSGRVFSVRCMKLGME